MTKVSKSGEATIFIKTPKEYYTRRLENGHFWQFAFLYINGQVRYEKFTSDYKPLSARISWFRREHPDYSIIPETDETAYEEVLMMSISRNAYKRIIATARKRETEIDFSE